MKTTFELEFSSILESYFVVIRIGRFENNHKRANSHYTSQC